MLAELPPKLKTRLTIGLHLDLRRSYDNLVDDVSLDLSTRLGRDELLGLFGLR